MRGSGIILPIFSLPSPCGIGTLGKSAYAFVDFLKKAGVKYWQVLPIGPTSYGDSPYQSFSTYAGNPYFVDFDVLRHEKLLKKSEYSDIKWGEEKDKVAYEIIFKKRFGVLKKAYKRFAEDVPEAFDTFCAENAQWLDDYALYMSLKFHLEQKSWTEWDDEIRLRTDEGMKKYRKLLADEISFWKFIQFKFYEQWIALKKYANDSGIGIIGDIPIYVAEDSADIWANPEVFELDEDLKPIHVAGCPPDCFALKGQLWGNPLYRWDYLKKSGYKWWFGRIAAAKKLFDVIRIDHFRGFESYYSIPAGSPDATIGTWEPGGGLDFIKAVKTEFKGIDIIAEDLGFLTPAVKKLLKASGFPGMKVLEFAFDGSDSDYLPHNYPKNCVVYTGTHDNETADGWGESLSRKQKKFLRDYLCAKKKETVSDALVRAAWSSTGDLAVAQMQDFLHLGNEARINVPSTLGTNWQWRMSELPPDDLADRIARLNKLYFR